jgi:tRNA-specific 2-thiouridylase
MEPSSKLIKRAIRDLSLHIHEALSSGGKPKVFLGMSGGVDSSVSAFLLKEAGFHVTGVFIKTWQPEGLICTWKDDRRDAMRVCAELGIPFKTLDLEDEYKQNVADYMIKEYAAGRTPNPDIMCNKHVKFGGFFEYAMKEGADFVATGHYAQTNDNSELVLSADEVKDQTYFLWAIPEEILPKIIFPIGSLKKDEVREIAKEAELSVFDKKDSQGVCFIGKLDMKEFLKGYLHPISGDVCDLKGKKIGTHDGAILYTIGERHGFTILNETTDAEPQFIIKKDIEKNILYVGPQKQLLKSDSAEKMTLSEVNFLSKNSKLHNLRVSAEARIRIRLRHRQPLQNAYVSATIDTKGGFALSIRCEEPQQGIASGQSCVLYDGDVCLGGGIIQ